MSLTLEQIFVVNPITTNMGNDLMYFSQFPYTPGKDAGMQFSNFAAQFNRAIVSNSVSGTTQSLSANNIYIFNNTAATTGTLPSTGSSTIGDTIKIKGRSLAPFIIQANTGQIIKFGATSSTVAGNATSAAGSDTIQLIYVAANEWSVDFAVSSGFVLA